MKSPVNPAALQAELLSQLAEPLVGESLFDQLTDLVFFVKNSRYEYVVVNQTLVDRCGLRDKRELIGRRADEVFPSALGQTYRAQDERVLRSGEAIANQLELHFHASGARGWCLTNKVPLRDRHGRVVGLAGVSQDLQSGNEQSADYAAVAKAIHYIQANYHEPLRVKALAERAGLSEYQFEQRIRRIFHITAGQLIQKTRMDVAVRRLRDSDAPVAVIAQDCGYSDQSAFTRQFRQAVGLSPTEYRREFRDPK